MRAGCHLTASCNGKPHRDLSPLAPILDTAVERAVAVLADASGPS
jgi:hypothetical protein